MAHRGGQWSCDNSMANFRASVENQVEGVETDIWLSKDGVPMVLHGGDDGQLDKYGKPDDYVYEWNALELIEIRLENGEPMPTLREFLDVYRGTETVINIELKGPLS